MMKKFIAPLLALLVSGCQIDPYTHAPTLTSTDWYDVGMTPFIVPSAFMIAASDRSRAPPFGTAKRSKASCGYFIRNQRTQVCWMMLS